MSGTLLLGISTLIFAAEFLIGLRFARMAHLRPEELPRSLRSSTPAQIGRMGRIMMIAAPVFFLVFAALCFGLLGPVEGITPIRFQ